MRPVECPREQDVLDALASGRWPARCDETLREHAASCGICADLVEVAGPLLDAAADDWAEVSVPAPGTVWWRAQLRARREVAREAERPVTIAQGFGWATAAVLLIALAWAAAPLMAAVAGMIPELPALPAASLPHIPVPSMPESVGLPDFGRWRLLAVAVLGWLVLAPLVIYFALLED